MGLGHGGGGWPREGSQVSRAEPGSGQRLRLGRAGADELGMKLGAMAGRSRTLARGLFSGVFLKGTHFDDGEAGLDEVAGLGQGRGLGEVVCLDKNEAADRLLGLEKGAVGDDKISADIFFLCHTRRWR
jgi:hypothetical protein